MKLYLDTSTNILKLALDDKSYEWETDHDMGEKIFEFIYKKLQENNADWQDISEITYFAGPGSFTGLRIGAAVVNTLVHELKVPLYDQDGNKHDIIMPNYGRPANISQPIK